MGVNANATGSQNANYGGKFYASDGVYSFGVWGEANGNNNSQNSAGIYGKGGSGAYAGFFEGEIKVTGKVYCSEVVESSDMRLKENIKPLSGSLQRILSTTPVTYHWIDKATDDGLKTGVIAQEIQKLFPELVVTQKNGMLGVNYIGLIPHLIKSIQEQQSQIEELKLLVGRLPVELIK
jgi:hypothetical protein